MFLSEDPKKIELPLGDKKYSVTITDKDEELDLDNLYEKILEVMKARKEECDNIQGFGSLFSGNGHSFLMGWLVRAIKKDSDWKINFKEETMSKVEYNEYMAKLCKKGAEYMAELGEKFEAGESDISLKTVPVGGKDGTNLF